MTAKIMGGKQTGTDNNDNNNSIVTTMSKTVGGNGTYNRDEGYLREKFPVGAVVLLALCAILQCYTLVNLFPYLGLMVKCLLRLDTTNEAGYYAGFVASSFTAGQFMSSYALGYASDAYGRKAVIILGLISTVVFSLSFGLSTTYTSALWSRFLLGFFNGIIPALRTSLRELCGPKHIMIAMTYMSGCKGASLVLGTGIGGLLAQPVLNYPTLFSEEGLFGRYPFLLPNLVGSCFALALIPFVVLYLPETKTFPKKITLRGSNTNSTGNCSPGLLLAEHQPSSYNSCDAATTEKVGGEKVVDASEGLGQQPKCVNSFASDMVDGGKGVSTIAGDGCCGKPLVACHVSDDGLEPGLCGPDGIIASPNVKTVLCLAVVLQIMYVGFEEVYPLWALSTPAVGGLGWGSKNIGKALITAGLALVASQLVLIPYVIKIFGAVTWQRMGCLMSVPAILSIPCVSFLSWNAPSLFLVSVSSITFVNYGMTSLNTTLVVASTSMVPANMRAKLGGLFAMAESVGRILGPPAYATTFAWSISPSAREWADGHFIFYASATTMLVVTAVGWKSLTLERLFIAENGGYAGVAVGLEDKKNNPSGSASVGNHAGGNLV